ncbi:MAG: serine/threonine protein kinase [Planctomycetota bacterium]|nr:MAG: serine/threonine protein kinase [Planctomycetota bacterium]
MVMISPFTSALPGMTCPMSRESDQHDARIGLQLGGWILRQRIGEGGMGVVYKAEKVGQPESLAAVKILTNHGHKRDARKRLAARFLRESEAAMTVQHDHVVRVFASGEEQQCSYLVMELVEGMSLGQILDGAYAIEVERVLKIGAAIARGLAAIHGKGIVHRDIKPDNILIGRGGVVKIADLGLAKLNDPSDSERLTASGVVVGTPLYVAPEAVRDAHRVTPATDIYSLGATLYHLLCGHPPFAGDSPYELMRAHLEQEPRQLREINPQVPKWLHRVVHRCLAKKAEARPSARELALFFTQGEDDRQHLARRWRMLALASISLAIVTIVAWRILARPADDQMIVQLELEHWRGPSLQWRSGQNPPQPLLPQQPISLLPGGGPLVIETTVAGIGLRWQAEIPGEAGQRLQLQPELRPQPASNATIDLPGSGLILVAGQAHSQGSRLSFSYRGRYPVVLMSPGLTRQTWIEVDETGIRDTGWRVVSWPDASHYFSTSLPTRSGDALPPLRQVPAHHVVSSGAFALQMGSDILPERPAEAQDRLSSAQVRSWLGRVSRHRVGLPNRQQAQGLSGLLERGVWFAEDDRLYFVGAPEASQAILVAIPSSLDELPLSP